MCGLAGSFTQDSKAGLSDKQRLKRARVLEGLLVANASRGTDATGIVTVCDDARCLIKKAMPSSAFVDDKDARKGMRTNHPLVIGHTRFGTTGKNTDANAHPFMEGNVVGAHNGVISNYTQIDLAVRDARGIKYPDWEYVEVDSQAVFRLLDYVGPGGYINAFKQVRGSAALVWHDLRNPEALWMVRHSNPLNLGWVPGMQTLFWSSQYDHLSAVLTAMFGDQWFSVDLKADKLYLFNRKNILKFEAWDIEFSEFSNQSYWNDTRAYWSEDTAADPNEDKDVKHLYPLAKVKRKDEGKGKAASTSTKTAGAPTALTVTDLLPTVTGAAPLAAEPSEEEVEALLRMGFPLDVALSELAGNGSPSNTSEEPAPFDDANCAVCQQPLEAVELGKYFRHTGEWMCSACLTFYEDEGDGVIEAMGRAH